MQSQAFSLIALDHRAIAVRASAPLLPTGHGTRAITVLLCLFLAASAFTAVNASGQAVEGTPGGAIAGGVLGAYSGGMLALVGSLIPCGQTMAGPTCSAWVVGIGGVVGATAGATVGAADDERFVRRVEAGMIGAAAGAVVGYALKGVVRQYGWLDVVSGAAIGLAVGSSAKGAAIGLGAGALAGGVLLATVPRVRVTDAVAVSAAGLALGGILGWVNDAVRANEASFTPVFSVSWTP